MSVDVSAAAAKMREKAERYRWDDDSSVGLAGVELTRREPPLLSPFQLDVIKGFAMTHLKAQQRDMFTYNVLGRLSGVPYDAAVKAAIAAAAIEVAGFETEQLRELGLVISDKNGRHRVEGGSKSVRGVDGRNR